MSRNTRSAREAVVALLVIGLVATACGSPNRSTPSSTAPPGTAISTPSVAKTSADSSSTNHTALTQPVHVSLLEGDGGVYGIGMPIIAYFDHAPTDAAAFEQATSVTVNGYPVGGAWFWQRSGRAGAALEAHYRLRTYWPAHARIFLRLPVKGLSAGAGLVYDDNLTLSVTTGAATIAVVDGAAERMTVTSDGKTVFSFPVSLGAANTPTYSGVKVVMEKDRVQEMRNNPGEAYYDLLVPWSVRLTNSGEFVHAASWNGGNIGIRSTSHGCTNLTVEDARRYFQLARIGDVFSYANTGGPRMPSWDGYGDWNLPWTLWQTGGALP